MKAIMTSALAAVLPFLAMGDGPVQRYLMPLAYYYANGVRVQPTTPVVTPSSASEHMIPFVPGTNFVFTALPPAGHKTDIWYLSSQMAITSAYSLDALTTTDEFEGDTVDVAWKSRYSDGANNSTTHYYLTPCFSWLTWKLAYRSNYADINGDYGLAEYIYTNSVTIADATNLWSATRTGYDVTGWSLTSTGDVQFASGQTLESGGDAFGVSADGETVYLYAVWQKRGMSISLDAQGGNVASNSVIVRIAEKYFLPTPTREGYTFDGWFTEASGGTKITSGETDVTSDDIETLYAHWTPIKFNLSYDWNWSDGTGAAPATRQYAYADAVTLEGSPVSWRRVGYDFLGWATNDAVVATFAPGETISPAGRYLGVAENNLAVRLLGVWRIRTMTIVLDAQGGTAAASSTTARVGESYSLPTPVREGYTFDGWFTAATAGEKIEDNTIVSRDDIKTLYAHWTLITYTLSYSWNWAAENVPEAPAQRTFGYIDTVTLAAPSWNRTGYDFLGWAESNAATEAAYAAGAELVNSGAIFGISATKRAVELFGVWQKREMKISLDAQGGNVSSNSVTVRIEEAYSLPTPVRDGFIFLGWFTAVEGGDMIADGDAVERDDISTLYAHWKVISFTFEYAENLAAPAASRIESFICDWTNIVEIAALPAAWSRTGWDFRGWSLDEASGSGEFKPGLRIANVGRVFDVVDGGTNTLHAIWKLRRMEIALDAEGDMEYSGGFVACVSNTVTHKLEAPPAKITVTVEGRYSLPVLMRRDAWFRGWWTALDGGDAITNGQSVVRDDIDTLYAHWEAKEVYDVAVNYRDSAGTVTNETQTVFDKDAAVMPGLDVVDAWTGHTFLRWEPEDFSRIESNTVFTAIYKTNEYDVVFDPNGGQGVMTPMHLTYDVATNLTANVFRHGKTDAWTFAGWALDDDPATPVFADGAEVLNLTDNDGAKVYLNAVWNKHLTDFSAAANTDVVLSANPEDWVFTNETIMAEINASNESKWVVTNLVETVSSAEGPVEREYSAIALMSPKVFLNKVELRGRIHGKGVLSFEYGANYGLGDGESPLETFDFSIDRIVAVSPVVKYDVWPTSNNFEKVEVDVADDDWHEIAWTLLSPSYQKSFFLRNITWKPEGQFFVSFDGGTNHLGVAASGAMDRVEFYQGEYGTLPRNLFTLTGYTFANWLCEYEYNGDTYQKLFEDRETTAWMTNDTTLVALWQPNSCFIRFGANGGDGEMPDQEILYDAPTALDANGFDRLGYTFVGWLFGGVAYSEGATVSNLTAEANAVLDFTAQWEANDYVAMFDANGGEGDALAPVPCTYDQAWTLPENPFERVGYSFAGWMLGDELFAAGDAVSNLTTEAGGVVTFVAVWEPNEFTVAFAGGEGAAGAMDSIAFTYGEPQALPMNLFSRTGWTFAGWTFGGATYSDSAIVSNLVADAGGVATLAAKWRAHAFTVNFDPNGGSGVMDAQGFTYGEATALAQCTFERTGYLFAGWMLDGVVFADGQSISDLTDLDGGEVTFTAIWTPIEYTVEFDGGASDVAGQMPSLKLAYDAEASLPLNEFSRVGYTFVQWRMGAQTFEDGALVTNLTTDADDVVTLTAEWKAHEYSVVFDANGGEGEMGDGDFTYGATSALAANSFTRTGYKFVGWSFYKDGEAAFADGGEISNLSASNGATVSLYAVWQPISYSVRFDANGGEGEMDDFALTYDEAANLPSNSFTRAGFGFVAWESGGVKYLDGAEVVNLAADEDAVVVFTAQWESATEPDPAHDDDETPEVIPVEVFPSGTEETSEFTATSTATYNGWLRDTSSGTIAALISVKTTAVKKAGGVSRSTIKVTPFSGKKATYKTTVAPGANPVDQYGIVYGALGLTGEFNGYKVEAALDYSKAKSGTPERAIADLLPLGAWAVAFDTPQGCATFSATVAKKGRAKVAGFMPDGSKFSASAQGILGANDVFAIPVMNAKKGVGFVLWVSAKGGVEVSDCSEPSWSSLAKSARANLADGRHSLTFTMPTWRNYIAATDVGGHNVTPIGEDSLYVAGGKWSVAKSVGKVAVVKLSSPLQTYVKIKDGIEPHNLAALKLKYTAKTGIVKGSFKLWYLDGEKLRSDKAVISGVVVGGKFYGVAAVKKFGIFKVQID